MMVSTKNFRVTLLASVALIIALVILVATSVIPPVKADTFPQAMPESAALAFWVNVAVNLFIGLSFAVIAIRAKRSRISITAIGILAAISLLLALAFLDAAGALKAHGPEMQGATTILFICAAAEFLAVVLAIIAMFLFPKRIILDSQS